MPVYDAEQPGLPKISDEQRKELKILDTLELAYQKIYQNSKGEKRRIIRIIRPAGALCADSEILRRYPSGEVRTWRTIDCAGGVIKINWINPDVGKGGVCLPSEWKAWAGEGEVKVKEFVPPKRDDGVDSVIEQAESKKKTHEAKRTAKRSGGDKE